MSPDSGPKRSTVTVPLERKSNGRWRRRSAVVAAVLVFCFCAILSLAWTKNPVFMNFPAALATVDSVGSLGAFGDFLITYYDVATRTMVYEDGTAVVPLSHEACALDGADLFDCGQRAWHRGEFRTSVEYFDKLIATQGESEEGLFWLAMAHLRLGEATNCFQRLLAESGHHGVHHDHKGMCSLPLEVLHRDKTSAKAARQLFVRLLDQYGPNALYRWLLNFSAMTAGTFPEAVPERYRLDKQGPFMETFYGAGRRATEAKYGDLRFRDVAPELAVDWSRQSGRPDAGRGIAVEDFNRDGCLDIVTIGGFGPAAYYENRCAPGELAFVERSVESHLATIHGGHIVSAADYDNDGWVDLLIGRPFGVPKGDFVLMRNRGGAVFEDVTRESGLIAPGDPRYYETWASAWGDIDNDGDLDLFVANWHFYNAYYKTSWLHVFTSLEDNAPSMLFRNDGGKFVNITEESGVAAVSDGHDIVGAAFGDYDADGRVDLALTRFYAPGFVLLHNAGGRFDPVEGIESPSIGFMTAFVDTDQDGRLDVFVGGVGTAEAITEQVVFQTSKDSFHTGSRIWRQTEGGTFTRDSNYFGDTFPLSVMGVSFGDLNHDGAIDWYLGTGNPEGWYVLPNQMFLGRPQRGNGPGTDNISMLHGFGTIQKGHGIVFADFDEDGDQDIYSSLGGYWPGDAWPNQLFLNESQTSNHWVKLRLRGCRANRDGLGATIAVYASHAAGPAKVVYYHMDNKTGFGSAPYLADIGLGDADTLERVDVSWLGPGGRRTLRYQVPLDRLSVLTEMGAVFDSRTEADESCAATAGDLTRK